MILPECFHYHTVEVLSLVEARSRQGFYSHSGNAAVISFFYWLDQRRGFWPGMVALPFNPSTWGGRAEAGKSLRLQGKLVVILDEL